MQVLNCFRFVLVCGIIICLVVSWISEVFPDKEYIERLRIHIELEMNNKVRDLRVKDQEVSQD